MNANISYLKSNSIFPFNLCKMETNKAGDDFPSSGMIADKV